MPGFIMTHMPFLSPVNGQVHRMHCKCPQGSYFWNLYMDTPDGTFRINTPQSPQSVHIFPTFWQDENGIHGSYVNGNGNTEPEMMYRLYRIEAPDMETFIHAPTVTQVMAVHIAHISPLGLAYGSMLKDHGKLRIRYDNHPHQDYIIPGGHLHNLNYRADAPHILLMTGSTVGNIDDIWTVHLNIITGTQYHLTCDDEPAYKITQLAGRFQYAHRLEGGQYQDRTIYEANRITYTPCEILQPIPVTNPEPAQT